MDLLDRNPGLRGGGRAQGGGGFYHLSFRSGSRASGSCARSAYAYVTRQDEYGGPDRDEAVYTESEHMPSWAADSPASYWDTADLYERANGRLYVSADFALPRDLSVEEQVELASTFAHALTDAERLPYTLAIHAGRDEEGQAHNPHAHLMFSERRDDGIERSREDWFRRANSEYPERGGAPKSRTFHGPAWIEHARERWAALTNEALERAGRSERVDHRSYARQGVSRDPSQHYGPAAAHFVERGRDHDRLDEAAAGVDDQRTLQAIEQDIAQLEAAREALILDGLPEDPRESERRGNGSSSPEEPDRDSSWGR
ncbi:MAG: MobA/MobL family protein [Acidobacteriota bacterium]